uniref:Putative secreted protein n=1 Tax=Ixodes ricinus TaxID=34613 RepID=A0A6B0U7R2_IXORI
MASRPSVSRWFSTYLYFSVMIFLTASSSALRTADPSHLSTLTGLSASLSAEATSPASGVRLDAISTAGATALQRTPNAAAAACRL